MLYSYIFKEVHVKYAVVYGVTFYFLHIATLGDSMDKYKSTL